jgi:hypothetical protein
MAGPKKANNFADPERAAEEARKRSEARKEKEEKKAKIAAERIKKAKNRKKKREKKIRKAMRKSGQREAILRERRLKRELKLAPRQKAAAEIPADIRSMTEAHQYHRIIKDFMDSAVLPSLQDAREPGNYLKYEMGTLFHTLFMAFVMQARSLAEYNGIIRNEDVVAMGGSPFLEDAARQGSVPSIVQMVNTLDGTDSSVLDPAFYKILEDLKETGYLDRYKTFDGHSVLVPMDGTGTTSSYRCECPECLTGYHEQSQKIQYHHQILGVAIASPQGFAFCPWPCRPGTSATRKPTKSKAAREPHPRFGWRSTTKSRLPLGLGRYT